MHLLVLSNVSLRCASKRDGNIHSLNAREDLIVHRIVCQELLFHDCSPTRMIHRVVKVVGAMRMPIERMPRSSHRQCEPMRSCREEVSRSDAF